VLEPTSAGNYRWATYLDIQIHPPRSGELTVFCGARLSAGRRFGFLWYNRAFPRKIFHGRRGHPLSLGRKRSALESAVIIKAGRFCCSLSAASFVWWKGRFSVDSCKWASFKLRGKAHFPPCRPIHLITTSNCSVGVNRKVIVRFWIAALVFLRLFALDDVEIEIEAEEPQGHRRFYKIHAKSIEVAGQARAGRGDPGEDRCGHCTLFAPARGANVTCHRCARPEKRNRAEQLPPFRTTGRQAWSWAAIGEIHFLNRNLIVPRPQGVAPPDAPLLKGGRALMASLSGAKVELGGPFPSCVGRLDWHHRLRTAKDHRRPSLVEHILKRRRFFSTILAGNIGTPLIAGAWSRTSDETVGRGGIEQFSTGAD